MRNSSRHAALVVALVLLMAISAAGLFVIIRGGDDPVAAPITPAPVQVPVQAPVIESGAEPPVAINHPPPRV